MIFFWKNNKKIWENMHQWSSTRLIVILGIPRYPGSFFFKIKYPGTSGIKKWVGYLGNPNYEIFRLVVTMANPTSAFFRAGPSLVPSPVTATTSRLALILLFMMPLTKVYLSTGWDRAKTRSLGQIWSSFCCDTWK